MFQGHFKHAGGSILLCLLLYTFFAWFYNCHRDTVVIILVYQVDSRQVSPASVTSSRFHTSPTLPKAHSHLRGLPAEDGFFGVRGWWVSEIQGTATVAWCCLMFDYFRMNSLNISEPSIHFDSLHSLLSHPTWTHLLLGCNLLTRCIRRAWAVLSQKEGHESTRKRPSSSGKVTRDFDDFDGLMGFGVPNFETTHSTTEDMLLTRLAKSTLERE